MTDFLETYNSRLSGVLKWPQLNAIWRGLESESHWYLYEIGRPVPTEKIDGKALKLAIQEIDTFLHQEHDVDYCGVVYADKLKSPDFLKIYHPKKMGASCGSTGLTVLPRWTLSKMPPVDLLEWSLEKDEKPVWWKHMLKKRA